MQISHRITFARNLIGNNAAGCDSIAILALTFLSSSGSFIADTGCDSYTWYGNTYNSNGTYTYNTTNAVGCDSVATLILSINHSTSSNTIQTACDSFTWMGNIYNSSGIYSFTSTNAAGCDSMMTLELTITQNSSSSSMASACDSYTWNGNTYTTSGNYTYITPNAIGCDSIVTLMLTIDTADVSVYVSANLLKANAMNASYQWVDCNNNYAPVNGATYQAFNSPISGNFAVIVFQNGCVDTSACYDHIIGGIGSNSFGKGFGLYPNPTGGRVSVELGNEYERVEVMVFDVLWRLVCREEYFDVENVDLRIEGVSGVYVVWVRAGDRVATVRVEKE